MGNNKSRETSFSRQTSDVIQPHSVLLDLVLTELLYCSDLIQVFNAYNINVKEASNLHILNYGFSMQGKSEWEKWIPPYQQLHHPWVLKILSNKIIEKEIGFKNHSSLVVLTEEYTISLGQILQSMMTTSPSTLRKIKSFCQPKDDPDSSNSRKRFKSEEKILFEKKFTENAIFKMLFMVIDALVYCYEKGFVVKISESNIIYCNKSDRFLISPFALVEDQEPVSVVTLDALFQNPDSAATKKQPKKKPTTIQDQDGDVSFQKDLIIKKQIFTVAVLGLKMAALKPLSKNPKDIKKALTEIKADFPELYAFLNMALYEIFRDHFELRKLLSHPLYDCVYSTKFSIQQDTLKHKNLKKSSMQFGKTYNLLENSEASLQCFQSVMSDLTNKKRMSLKEEIEYSEVLKFTAEGYLQTNFVDQAKLHVNKCLDVLDKIAVTTKHVNLSDLYCEIARLCLKAADVSLAILVLEKASKNYFENHQLEEQSVAEIRIWREIEFKLYELKKSGKVDSMTTNLERLAELSWVLDDITAALEYRKILIKLSDKDSKNFWKIGEIYMKLFEYDEALKAHEKCLLIKTSQSAEDDSIFKSLMRIGQVYEYKFEYDKAINTYQKAYDLKQKAGQVEDLPIMEALARCYESFGDLDGSLKWLEEIVSTLDQNITELNGDYVAKIYEIARILELQRNYSEAFKHFQKCVEIIAKHHLDEQDLFNHSNKAILRLTNFLQSSMT